MDRKYKIGFWIIGVLAVLALALVVFRPAQITQLGGTTFEHGIDITEGNLTVSGTATLTGTSTHSTGATIGEVSTYWEAGTLALGDAQDCWQTGKAATVFIDYAEAYVNGTASTTLTLDIATTSASTMTQDQDPYAELIDSYSLATSTAYKLINSEENQGTNGISVIPVTSADYVCVYLTDPLQIDGICTGAVCENATSTARGYTLDYKLHYHY